MELEVLLNAQFQVVLVLLDVAYGGLHEGDMIVLGAEGGQAGDLAFKGLPGFNEVCKRLF